jgi:hypothetical protein
MNGDAAYKGFRPDPAQKKAPAQGRGEFVRRRCRGGGHYLPFFFAAGLAALLVVFFETGFLAAAM